MAAQIGVIHSHVIKVKANQRIQRMIHRSVFCIMASQIGVLNSHVIKVKANKRIETKNDTQKCNELQNIQTMYIKMEYKKLNI